jgi:hypothetical protein
MYLVKELCDLKAEGDTNGLGPGVMALDWAYHGVISRIQTDAKFRGRMGSIRRDVTPLPLLSLKRVQGDGQFIASPAHYLILASTLRGSFTFTFWTG